VNFNYFISETVFNYIVDAVQLVAHEGWRLLADYRFDPVSGLWRHRNGPAEPPVRLHQVRFDSDGRMLYPRHHHRASEGELERYLAEARALFAAVPEDLAQVAGFVSPDFEHLRWFELPAVCLADLAPNTATGEASSYAL